MNRILNWSKVDPSTLQGTKVFKTAVAKYFASKYTENIKSVNHFTMRTDFPTDGLPALEQLRKNVVGDLGYQLAFQTIDFTNGGAGGDSGFDVVASGSGLVLAEVPDGMKAKVFEASGQSVRVPFIRYEGGLLYIKTLVEDGRWWDLESTMMEAENAYNTAIATSHYGLLEALGAGINVTWQNPTPAALANTDYNYVVSRDANTVNAAIIDIISNANGWMGINPGSSYVVIAPLQLAQRINQAVAADRFGVKKVGFDVTVVSTAYLSDTGSYYVAPVGGAGRSGLRKAMEIEFDKDVLANAETMVCRGRWGATAFATTVRRCASS